MMLAVLSFSATPLLFTLGAAAKSPFLFAGVVQVSIGLCVGGLIFLNRHRLLMDGSAMKCIKSRWTGGQTWLFVFSNIGSLEFVLFAAALAFVDVAVVTLLYELWVLAVMLVVWFLYSDRTNGSRYHGLTGGMVCLVLMAFSSVGLVLLSHNDAPVPILAAGSHFATASNLVGVALVLAAAVCGGAQGCTLRLGTLLAENHPIESARRFVEMVFAVGAVCACKLFAGILFLVAGWLLSETISAHQLFYALLAGMFVNAVGVIAWRAANLKTTNPGLNALCYAAPLLALLWLWLFSILDVPHPDYLTIGAMGIVTMNLLINAAPTARGGYRAFVAALWGFGALNFLAGEYAETPLLLQPFATIVQVFAAGIVFVCLGIVRSPATRNRIIARYWNLLRRHERDRPGFQRSDIVIADSESGMLDITQQRPGTRRLVIVSSVLIVTVFAWLFTGV